VRKRRYELVHNVLKEENLPSKSTKAANVWNENKSDLRTRRELKQSHCFVVVGVGTDENHCKQ
jgi:hypothetical protein